MQQIVVFFSPTDDVVNMIAVEQIDDVVKQAAILGAKTGNVDVVLRMQLRNIDSTASYVSTAYRIVFKSDEEVWKIESICGVHKFTLCFIDRESLSDFLLVDLSTRS